MSKAKFILGAIELVAIGGASVAYAAGTDECSRAPDGSFHWELLGEGYAHLIDSDAACDPWQVVAPDPDLTSITIGFTDGWNFEPSIQVKIDSGGTIAVLEPIDEVGMKTREVARGHNPALAKELLGSLSRFTRYNRFPDQLPEGADLSNPETYLTAPVMRCTGEIFDGGSVGVQFNLRQRANQAVMYNSSCSSIAYSRALTAFHEAHRKGLEAAGFEGDTFGAQRKGS
ncbi:MAG: hypothetical protein NBV68_16325 [Erythrobacter sp.]|uniref:hypothetical protein n=1 Tax=Erythrobacter sp. TaxID=1042 RepID=UPI0025D21A9F|nr:hypothetical protein [Erythrobacter sp.]MCM0000943.1 hypothetical protein [Erythrobacter sp.]